MKKLIVLFSTAVMFFSSCQLMETPYFPPLNGLVLNMENATMILEITESMQLSATVVPLRSTDKLILEWESSDPLVVQIDQNGVMIPLSIGKSIITVRATSGDKTLTATCEVEVISQWESLGIGQFYDAFLRLGLVDVEVQQSIVDRNKYRVIDPYPVSLVSQDSWYGGPRAEEIEFWVTSGANVTWDKFWYIGLNYQGVAGQPIKAYLPSALAASQAPNDARSKFLTDKKVFFNPYYYVDDLGGYGLQSVYLTLPGESDLTDSRDGKVYKTVTIGEQVWMAENLAYLPSVFGPATISSSTAYYYVYDYNGTDVAAAKATDNYQTYGVLYNWPAAMAGAASSDANPSGVQGVCPDGWHLPSDAEWTQLEEYLIANGYNYDGTTTGNQIAKSMVNYSGWNTSSTVGAVGNTDYPEYRNKSGFTALPGGYRNYSGTFGNVGGSGLWWSSTQSSTSNAWYRSLNYSYSSVTRGNYNKGSGFSVRCVRD
ncbi:MAG: FISUMP domain-containing protein [Bacteroidales bacterium]|nr:FISUMP domain-containing protein [Bacteroidales bacterium]